MAQMEVFLFPLINATLFSQTTKPLSIFEPRYITMIKEAIQSQTPIAIGFIDDPSRVSQVVVGQKVPFVREIAGYGYPQIVEERLNGSLLIFLQGRGKLRLGNVIDNTRPYIVCEAQSVRENLTVDPLLMGNLETLNKVLSRWIYTHIQDNAQRDLFLRNISQPEEVVGCFASYLVRDYDLQQLVLEQDDINEKLRFLHRLIESNELTF